MVDQVTQVSGYGNGKYATLDDLERRSGYRDPTTGEWGNGTNTGNGGQDTDELDGIMEDTIAQFDEDGDGELEECNENGINERKAANDFLNREGDDDGDNSIDVSGSGGDDDTGRTQDALDALETGGGAAKYFRGDKAFEEKYGTGGSGFGTGSGSGFDASDIPTMTFEEFKELLAEYGLDESFLGFDVETLFGPIFEK